MAVIVELLNPQDYGMKAVDWKYTDNGSGEQPSLVYLSYGNRWTKTKAQNVLNNLDIIANDLIKDEEEGIENLSDFIVDAINGLFEVDTINSLAETLQGLIGSLLGDDEDDEDEEEPTTAPTTEATTAAPTETTTPTSTTEPATEPEDEDEDEFEFEFSMLFDISLPWLLELLEKEVGLEFADVLSTGFRSMFTSVAKPYTSANGSTAYTTFGAIDTADVFTVVLSMGLEVVTYGNNAVVLDEMLGTDGILPAVTSLFAGFETDMEEFDWIWFDPDFTGPLYGDTEVELPERSIVYLSYPNNWSEATADYLDAHLADIVDSVIRSIDDEYSSLSEMLADLTSTTTTVNSILKALKDLTRTAKKFCSTQSA